MVKQSIPCFCLTTGLVQRVEASLTQWSDAVITTLNMGPKHPFFLLTWIVKEISVKY